jgi:hypothetical protein
MPLSLLILPIPMSIDGVISLPRGTIAIERTKFLWQAVCYERIGITPTAPDIFASTLGLAPIFAICSKFAEPHANGAARPRRWSPRTALGFTMRGSTRSSARRNCASGPRLLVLRQIARRLNSSLHPRPGGRSSCGFFARTGTSHGSVPLDVRSGRGGAQSGARRPTSRRSKARTNYSMKSAGRPPPTSTC